MADIMTDPRTGQQRSVEVRYDQGGGMDDINPQAIQRLFETQKMEDAEKALSAAIQFQGVRGYQQALKSGEPAEKALTRYGPMMFYQRPSAFGPAVRAVTPPRVNPVYRSGTLPGSTVRINPDNSFTPIVEGRPVRPPNVRPRTFSAAAGLDPLMMNPPSRVSMTEPEFRRFMESAPPELRTNSINTTIQRMIEPPPGTNSTVQFKTPDDVRAAFKSNKLSRDEAKKILTEQFGMK